MHNVPQIFTFGMAEVRIIVKDGEPWFVAKDVAEVLGYTDTDQAIRMHCKASCTHPVEMTGQVRHVKIIPERDVYRLILRSKLPAAERFEEWVVGEVLPQIRKTGGYIPTANRTPEQIMAEAILIAQATIEEQKRQLEAAKPKVVAYDSFMETGGVVSLSNASAHFGMSAQALSDFLLKSGVFKVVKEHGKPRRIPKVAFQHLFVPKQELYAPQKCSTKVYVTHEGMGWLANRLPQGLSHDNRRFR